MGFKIWPKNRQRVRGCLGHTDPTRQSCPGLVKPCALSTEVPAKV